MKETKWYACKESNFFGVLLPNHRSGTATRMEKYYGESMMVCMQWKQLNKQLLRYVGDTWQCSRWRNTEDPASSIKWRSNEKLVR